MKFTTCGSSIDKGKCVLVCLSRSSASNKFLARIPVWRNHEELIYRPSCLQHVFLKRSQCANDKECQIETCFVQDKYPFMPCWLSAVNKRLNHIILLHRAKSLSPAGNSKHSPTETTAFMSSFNETKIAPVHRVGVCLMA